MNILQQKRGYQHWLRCTLNIIKKLRNATKNTSIIQNIRYNNKIIKIRVIKYFIDDTEYYLCTTIYNKSINYFIDLYWKRWKVETNFKQSKYDLSMLQLKSKNKNSINQDISIHNFIFIIAAYLKFLIQNFFINFFIV